MIWGLQQMLYVHDMHNHATGWYPVPLITVDDEVRALAA
jgi:hypothetical protein